MQAVDLSGKATSSCLQHHLFGQNFSWLSSRTSQLELNKTKKKHERNTIMHVVSAIDWAVYFAMPSTLLPLHAKSNSVV